MSRLELLWHGLSLLVFKVESSAWTRDHRYEQNMLLVDLVADYAEQADYASMPKNLGLT